MIDIRGKIEMLEAYERAVQAVEAARAFKPNAEIAAEAIHVTLRARSTPPREFVNAFEQAVRDNFETLKNVAILALEQERETRRNACHGAGLKV